MKLQLTKNGYNRNLRNIRNTKIYKYIQIYKKQL